MQRRQSRLIPYFLSTQVDTPETIFLSKDSWCIWMRRNLLAKFFSLLSDLLSTRNERNQTHQSVDLGWPRWDDTYVHRLRYKQPVATHYLPQSKILKSLLWVRIILSVLTVQRGRKNYVGNWLLMPRLLLRQRSTIRWEQCRLARDRSKISRLCLDSISCGTSIVSDQRHEKERHICIQVNNSFKYLFLYLPTFSESNAWDFHLVMAGISGKISATSEDFRRLSEDFRTLPKMSGDVRRRLGVLWFR